MVFVHIDKDLLYPNAKDIIVQSRNQYLHEILDDIASQVPDFGKKVWNKGFWLQEVKFHVNGISQGFSPQLNLPFRDNDLILISQDKKMVTLFWNNSLISKFGKERSITSYGANVREFLAHLNSTSQNVYEKLIVNDVIVQGLELQLNLSLLPSSLEKLANVQIKRDDVLFIKDANINPNEGVQVIVNNNFRRIIKIDSVIKAHGSTVGETFGDVIKQFPDFQKLWNNGQWFKAGGIFLNNAQIMPGKEDFVNTKVSAATKFKSFLYTSIGSANVSDIYRKSNEQDCSFIRRRRTSRAPKIFEITNFDA